MVFDSRVTYRRRKSYNTKSNKKKVVRTPGKRHVVQYLGKKGGIVRNPSYLGGARLRGLKQLRPAEKSRSAKSSRTVSRPYGGVLSHDIVRERIIRAFLIEEQKIVKRVLKMKKEEKKQ